MTTITCPDTNQLKAFYLGQLPEELSDDLVNHISVCLTCQVELETVVDSEDSLIANLLQSDDSLALDREPACEIGILRALGALADASEPRTDFCEAGEGSSEAHQVSIKHEGTPFPKSIGEYEVLRTLGAGGMGRVYLARHSKLGRLVALKILAGHRLGDRRASQRFESEMRVIGRLSHPNIVIAHDARDIDGTAVLVTEYIEGFDLGQLLHRTGPLGIADACEIACQVAEALQYTSDQGFVHRDIKPSNIMLSNLGEVKLLDLGLARLQYGDTESAEITGTGQTMGTADFISPEQVTDSRQVDIRSDIYSLGATMYKLLVGRPPFADDKHMTSFAKMTAHVSVTPSNLRTIRNDIPLELDRLVMAMLSKRPNDRPQSPTEIVELLSQYRQGSNLIMLAEKGLSLAKVPDSSPLQNPLETKARMESFWNRPIRRSKAVAASLLGGMLGLALGIIITITHQDGSKTRIIVPDDSKVEIANSPKGDPNSTIQVSQSSPMAVEDESTKKVAPPLQFAFLVNRESSGREPFIKESEVNAMLEQLPKTNSNAVVRTESTKFVRLSEKPSGEIPISGWNNGYQYALVSTDPKYSIGWDEIAGRILQSESSATPGTKERTLTLKFDEKLGAKMRSVSSTGIHLQLAILVDDLIVQMPRVNSEIGSDVLISGIFSEKQLQNMRQYLNVSLAESDKQVTTSVTVATDVVVSRRDIDFGLVYDALAESLIERSDTLSSSELDRIAKKMALATSWAKEDVSSPRRAVMRTWPFKSIQGMSQGNHVGPEWLYHESQTAYNVNISRSDLVADLRAFVDGWSDTKSLFDSAMSGLAKDPSGPQIDLERDIFPRLEKEVVLLMPSGLIAFKLSDVAAVQEKVKAWSSHGDGNPKLIGNYLLFGSKQALDAASNRFESSTRK